tara:strand:+ start:402 stop:854 length:453 start_codon:yes stop_codon:yes gene_type:complete
LHKRNPSEWLCFKRTARFGETDSAGVVHFLQLFKWCHESWEESLEKYGIPLQDIFPTSQIDISQLDVALPVINCEANYFKPVYVGDIVNIELYPEKKSDDSFILRFELTKNGKQIGMTKIQHVSINPITRKKCLLSKQINLWIEESVVDF